MIITLVVPGMHILPQFQSYKQAHVASSQNCSELSNPDASNISRWSQGLQNVQKSW